MTRIELQGHIEVDPPHDGWIIGKQYSIAGTFVLHRVGSDAVDITSFGGVQELVTGETTIEGLDAHCALYPTDRYTTAPLA